MARPNLLKIDDVLLRAARTVGLLWLLASTIGLGLVVNAGSTLLGPGLLALVAGSAPLGLLIAGLKLRRRENRAWALHRLVDDHVEIPASDLLRDSDFTAKSLGRAIRDLNNAGASFVVWDREADVVQDGRLRRTLVEIEVCGSCSAKVSLSLRIGDVRAARCPYCHDPLRAEGLLEEKARLIDELDADPATARPDPRSSFSLPIFVVLTIVFWPLAVGYALWHWHASPRA
jgi:hypothetical protein